MEATVLERLQTLVQRAERGDKAALPELRVALDANPWVWRDYGHIGAHALTAWVRLITGPNLMAREALERALDGLWKELAGDDPSQVERLLVARILSCWLQVNHADGLTASLKDASPNQHALALRRQDRRSMPLPPSRQRPGDDAEVAAADALALGSVASHSC